MRAPTRTVPRTRVQRHPERATEDRETILRVLDEALICHIGFLAEGVPWVIPTMYARQGDTLYIHGSPLSRMVGTAGSGAEVCVTVTLLDGLVLARSVFNHSMNYRSVVVVGVPQDVTDPPEKMAAFKALVDHVLPGRWEDARQPSQKELAATRVLRLPLDEASCKLRRGGPKDPRRDAVLPVWAGEIPIQLQAGPPRDADDLPPGLMPPPYASGYHR